LKFTTGSHVSKAHEPFFKTSIRGPWRTLKTKLSFFFKLSLVFFGALQGWVYFASQCLCSFTQGSCQFLEIYITDYH